MTEIGETVSRVDTLIWETKTFQEVCNKDIARAEEVVTTGKWTVKSEHLQHTTSSLIQILSFRIRRPTIDQCAQRLPQRSCSAQMRWIESRTRHCHRTADAAPRNTAQKSWSHGARWKGMFARASRQGWPPKHDRFIMGASPECILIWPVEIDHTSYCSFTYLQANIWCARGVELLASQRIEKCSMSADYAEQSLREVQQFILSANEFCVSSPREFRNVFQESTTPETKALVSQVSADGSQIKSTIYSNSMRGLGESVPKRDQLMAADAVNKSRCTCSSRVDNKAIVYSNEILSRNLILFVAIKWNASVEWRKFSTRLKI